MKPDQLMRMSVTDLLTPAQLFPSSDPVSKLVGYLNESNLREALIDDGGSTDVIGVRDLLKVTSLSTRISTLMHQLPRLGPNNTVRDAATLMHELRTRTMPVYRQKVFLGQVTSPSIVAKLLDTDAPGRVSSIMTPNPVSMDVSDTVSKAREAMLKKNFDQLPVTEGGALHGVVTADEIVFNLMPKTDRNQKGETASGRFDEKLGVFADRDAVTSEITDGLREVYQNISKRESNYSLILNTGEVQGVVTYRDFLRVLTRKTADNSIPMYVVGLPEDPFEAETARGKFLRAVELLRKASPDLSEARAVIKMGETKSPKKKYEVKVFLVYPRNHYSYGVFSYELADAFDKVSDWMKELVERSRTRPRKRTPTARSYPDDFRPETAPG